jgi:putative aldouronate transport system substrate-binding protein
MKRLFVMALVGLLALAYLPAAGTSESGKAASGSTTAAATAQDPFGKEPSLVVFTTGRVKTQDPKMPEGEDPENNDLVKFVEDQINVRPKIIWTTSDQGNAFESKVNLLIASADIPDVLELTALPYGMTMLKKLVTNDMIQDLTAVYENYASPSFKEHHASAGNAALKTVTFNGKLMALPNVSDTESQFQLTWMRKDWLDKLGLTPPKNVDDVVAIAKAFMEKDPDGNGKADTYGILGSSDLYRGSTNTFEWLFNAYNSFPGDWIKDAKGAVVYGSLTKETRAALARLQKLYKDGLIDKEFALKDGAKTNELLINGKAGIQGNAWWAPWWPLNTVIQNDWNAQWYAYGIAGTDGKVHYRATLPTSGFLVIKKGFKSPQAVIKANNVMQQASVERAYPWYDKLLESGGKYSILATQFWPTGQAATYFDEISRRWKVIKSVIDGKAARESVDPQARLIYDQLKPDMDNPEKHLLDSWTYNVAWAHGADALIQRPYTMNMPAFAGVTDTMVKKMTPMRDLEIDVFTKIVMNKLPIEEFDTFVTQWKQMGGDEITREINDLVK